jgi:hypothetical protein
MYICIYIYIYIYIYIHMYLYTYIYIHAEWHAEQSDISGFGHVLVLTPSLTRHVLFDASSFIGLLLSNKISSLLLDEPSFLMGELSSNEVSLIGVLFNVAYSYT